LSSVSDKRQADLLDEEFDIGVETEVQFVKLTPLVGGLRMVSIAAEIRC